MENKTLIAWLAVAAVGVVGYDLAFVIERPQTSYAQEFAVIAENGNSTCSAAFVESIDAMKAGEHVRGSCCSPMDLHRYEEQRAGLNRYAHIPEIPPDPYNIEAGLAQKLKGYDDRELASEQQAAYDYAVQHSNEKGPCCCKCWRWYVYGGLGKYLITHHNFTGEQIVDIWNLSDGCGGAGEHVH